MAQQVAQVYTYAKAITPSDTVDITKYEDRYPDAIWVGVAGTIIAVMGNSETVTFKAGIGLLPVQGLKRINAGSTTATDMVALWQV